MKTTEKDTKTHSLVGKQRHTSSQSIEKEQADVWAVGAWMNPGASQAWGIWKTIKRLQQFLNLRLRSTLFFCNSIWELKTSRLVKWRTTTLKSRWMSWPNSGIFWSKCSRRKKKKTKSFHIAASMSKRKFWISSKRFQSSFLFRMKPLFCWKRSSMKSLGTSERSTTRLGPSKRTASRSTAQLWRYCEFQRLVHSLLFRKF